MIAIKSIIPDKELIYHTSLASLNLKSMLRPFGFYYSSRSQSVVGLYYGSFFLLIYFNYTPSSLGFISYFTLKPLSFEPDFYLLAELDSFAYSDGSLSVYYLTGMHLQIMHIPNTQSAMAPMIHPKEMPTMAPSEMGL